MIATPKVQTVEVRQNLFNRIAKLSLLVEEVRKKHESDAYILDDPIAEMQIEIPPQLFKYASYAAPKPDDENNENGPNQHVSKYEDLNQSKELKQKKISRPSPNKKRPVSQEEIAVVERLYSAKART